MGMGLNPFNGGSDKASPADLAMVAGAVIACIVAIGWALLA